MNDAQRRPIDADGSSGLRLPPRAESVFKALMQGDYLSPLGTRDLWADLTEHERLYLDLFSALGQALVIDPRGFAYLEQPDRAASVNKRSRQMAVLLVELFTMQMDRNQSPIAFQDWAIDKALITDLVAHGGETLRAVELGDVESVEALLASAAKRRLTQRAATGYKLLRPVHLYLDAFLHITSEQTDPDETVAGPAVVSDGAAWGVPAAEAEDPFDGDEHGLSPYEEEEPE